MANDGYVYFGFMANSPDNIELEDIDYALPLKTTKEKHNSGRHAYIRYDEDS